MKIRYGFVSNSSSSSFTCDICGNTESGFDQGPEELGFKRCQNDHCFCVADELPHDYTNGEKREILKAERRSWWNDEDWNNRVKEIETCSDETLDDYWSDYVGDGGLPPLSCPICSMERVSKNDRYQYLLRLHGKTAEEVDAEIKAGFPNYESFKEYLYPPKQSDQRN